MVRTLSCIVEGQGDVVSIPIVLRRLAEAAGVHDLQVTPLRIPRYKIVREGEFERAIELGLREAGGDGRVLLVVDADDDCPAKLGQELKRRAEAARPDRTIGIVLANREKEAWFIAAIESLRGQRGIRRDVERPSDPESIRGAKEWIKARTEHGSYSEITDQPALSATFDLDAASSVPSFARLRRVLGRLLQDASR